MRRGGLVIFTMVVLLPLSCMPMNVSAHTPSTFVSILSSDGPKPENITQSTDFFEGDEVKFLMKDDGENVTMRVSIDIDGDGVFNQSNDVFSNWLNYSCELNENGTETLDENCTVEFKYRFDANNSTGTYYYQVERRVGENHTNSWMYTIFVGVDIHQDGDSQLPNIGDCFGDACEEEVVVEVQTSNDDFSDYLKITILISLVAVIILTISIIKDSSSVDEKLYINLEEE